LKGEYIVPGPDYIWSVDGYKKLSKFGIQIYAAIDIYSRYVIWVYIGISNRTATSVLAQYLWTVYRYRKHLYIIRSDRGVETPIFAEVYYCETLQYSGHPVGCWAGGILDRHVGNVVT
jgi:hypothetical protein